MLALGRGGPGIEREADRSDMGVPGSFVGDLMGDYSGRQHDQRLGVVDHLHCSPSIDQTSDLHSGLEHRYSAFSCRDP